MKIKIVQCTSNIYWYCDKIGSVYEAKDHDHKFYVLADNISLVRRTDCVVMKDDTPLTPLQEMSEPVPVKSEWSDAHYASFSYTLTQEDVDTGSIKIDPYFVAKQWSLGKRDDSGILFHNLKTIARFGDKNSREREIVALYKQVKRLAEIENVKLD